MTSTIQPLSDSEIEAVSGGSLSELFGYYAGYALQTSANFHGKLSPDVIL